MLIVSLSFQHVQGIIGMTVAQVIKNWTDEFQRNKVPEAEDSIKHILSSVLGLKNAAHLEIVRNQILTQDEHQMLLVKADLRLNRNPVQYIIGEWDFCGLTLKMCHTPPVFIPRPETEDLVSIASDIIAQLISFNEREKSYNPRCFEVGCGSGAISLALLSKHEKLRCTAIDANPAAVSLARLNSELLGLADRVSFSIAKWEEDGAIGLSSLNTTKYDILVSNPPYIPTSEISDLAPEIVRYEPHLALDGGPDGTRVIKHIIQHAPKWLRQGSFIILEIDPRQTKMIRLISEECGSYVGEVDVRKDCFGVERFVILRCK
ncbi:MTRF1L release factor glutamine methyltransferase-like isoform X2 [Daphnia pulicaria]|uniref:MTRF1L release factor glutamine methyltransferase-like isoform X2 n=1 Tax=Daphnia pulicaria TaxID=35523 RepID=UPI001EEBD3C0|nr:MTRF1L release factor glutamine methyltransferase-like isoform X2 [Daphnia pulicaria]XP_046644165.1 MTRF1L release factor glutamine methyltransferase-like isoform X2 [Daphnia pulicaria]